MAPALLLRHTVIEALKAAELPYLILIYAIRLIASCPRLDLRNEYWILWGKSPANFQNAKAETSPAAKKLLRTQQLHRFNLFCSCAAPNPSTYNSNYTYDLRLNPGIKQDRSLRGLNL
jgi:hypothetical protein